MEEFYLQIRTVHIWAVTASGLLFALRGGTFNLMGASWPKALPVRLLSWTIDTILLTAALMLMTVVRQYPFVDHWLTVKVVLLSSISGSELWPSAPPGRAGRGSASGSPPW